MIKPFVVSAMLIAIISCDFTQNNKSIEERLKVAENLLAQKQYGQAAIEYQSVIKQDKQSVKGYYGLAAIAEVNKNDVEALKHLRAIIKLDPTDVLAHQKMGKIYLYQGEIDEALKIKAVLERLEPNAISTLSFGAAAFFKAGNQAEAFGIAAEILTMDPYHFDASVLMARKFFLEKKYSQAITVLSQALEKKPENIRLNRYKIQSLVALGHIDEAKSIFRRLVDLHPSSRIALDFSRFHFNLGDKQQAKRIVLDYAQQNLSAIDDRVAITRFLNELGFYGESLELLHQYQVDNPKQLAYSLLIAEQYTRIHQYAKARAQYQRLIQAASQPESTIKKNQGVLFQAKLRFANFEYTQGNIDEAKRLIDEVLIQNTKSKEALLFRSRLFVAERNYKSAIVDLRRLITIDKENVDVFLRLADAYLRSGQERPALSIYKKMMSKYPNNKKVLAAHLYTLVALKRYDEAHDYSVIWLKENQNDVDVLRLQAEINAGRKAYKKLQATVKQLESLQGGTAFSYYGNGIAYSGLKENSNAVNAFKQSLALDPVNFRAALRLLHEYILLNKVDAAITYFKRQLNNDETNPLPHFMLAQAYEHKNEFKIAADYYEKTIARSSNDIRGYISLARIQYTQALYSESEQTLFKAIQVSPESSVLFYELGNVYNQQHNFKKAIQAYGKAYVLDPSNLFAANNYISLISDYSGSDEDLQGAKKLAEQLESADNPDIIDTVGWFHYRRGDFYKAALLLEKAVQFKPSKPVYHYHLGMVYKAQNRGDAAKKFLLKAVDTGVDFDGLTDARQALKSL